MPSFSTEVKNELARLMYSKQCCQRSELAALLRMGASLTMGFHRGEDGQRHTGISFDTENAAVARKALTLIKSISKGDVQTEVTVSRSRRLKKNNRYSIRAVPSIQVNNLLNSIGLLKGDVLHVGSDAPFIKKQCCRVAYLRGAFQGGGSVNRPDASSHLEMVAGNYAFGATLNSFMRKLDLPVGFIDRGKSYIIYLKDGEAILDFLGILEAHKSVEELEVARNIKEVRSQVNRIVNCETANLQRTAEAAAHQLECIRKLEEQGRLDSLPKKLLETALMRRAYPDVSFAELAELLHVSKSGVSHRLRKIEELVRDEEN